MDGLRRCEDCRRIVRGSAGDACPYCGGEHLAHIAPASPPTGIRHPSVITAVITFCVGLSALRIVILYFGQHFSVTSGAYGDVLWDLQLLITISTAMYLVLRRAEGDFRALFIISFGLFIATECLASLVRSYGFISLHNLVVMFNMTLFIYSSLCLTASIADGPRREYFSRCLTRCSIGFMFYSALRTFFEMKGRDAEVRTNMIMSLALLGLIVYLGAQLIHGEMRARSRSAAADYPELPPAPLDSSAAEQVLTPEGERRQNV
jgi:hypothetical protein